MGPKVLIFYTNFTTMVQKGKCGSYTIAQPLITVASLVLMALGIFLH
jgi:hypothetical protein